MLTIKKAEQWEEVIRLKEIIQETRKEENPKYTAPKTSQSDY
jgi:hypothetical protein